MRDLSADRQPQTSPAVLAACGSVRLLKRLKDDSLFVGCNSNSSVLYRKGNNHFRAVQAVKHEIRRSLRNPHIERDASGFGELEGVRKQVLENLLQPFFVGLNGQRKFRLTAKLKFQMLVQRHLMETHVQTFQHVDEWHFDNINRHHSRLDLRQVKDVINQ